jgi:hypothetical protein
MEPETLRSEVERMQDYAGPLSEDQIALLVGLLSDPEASARVEQARGAAEAEEEATAEIEELGSAETGAALFTGARRLTNGGLPCAACHRATRAPSSHPGGGGNFAADLAGSLDRLGRAGLLRAAEKTAFPVMRSAYRDHPVTHEEAVHLAAFLTSAGSAAGDGSETGAAGGTGGFPLAPWGSGVALGCLALLGALYRNRRQRGGGVRARLLRRAARS